MKRWKEILKRIGKHAIGAEIGVWNGENAGQLLDGNDTLWLACIDQWKANDSEYIKSKDGKSKLSQKEFDKARETAYHRLKEYKGRCWIIPLPSAEAIDLFEGKMFDFVFIDANHSYESVKQDIATWKPVIRQGGWIGGHDYQVYHGVKKAVDETFGKDVELGEDFTWFAKIQ